MCIKVSLPIRYHCRWNNASEAPQAYVRFINFAQWRLNYPFSMGDRKSTRLNSSHQIISYAVFCLKKKIERSAHERGAQNNRLARHLFTIATTAAPVQEVRVMGMAERLITERRVAWSRRYLPVARS